jgi:hypothetical protein
MAAGSKDLWDKIDVVVKGLIPAVLALATYVLNQRQSESAGHQFYAQLMGQREQADSTMRKDMFRSILETFVDRTKTPRDPRQAVVNLEILAYNFHDALDLTPLFKFVSQDLRESQHFTGVASVERLAGEVISKQIDALREPDKRNLIDASIPLDKLHRDVGGTGSSDDAPGFLTAIERRCVGLTDNRAYRRRFVDLEVYRVDRAAREMEVRITVGKPAPGRCPEPAATDRVQFETEQDTQFTVSLFDFPMVDNLRLENDDRIAVVLTRFFDAGVTDEHPQAAVQVVYFPGSRASLKEKPYYEKIVENLARR